MLLICPSSEPLNGVDRLSHILPGETEAQMESLAKYPRPASEAQTGIEIWDRLIPPLLRTRQNFKNWP